MKQEPNRRLHQFYDYVYDNVGMLDNYALQGYGSIQYYNNKFSNTKLVLQLPIRACTIQSHPLSHSKTHRIGERISDFDDLKVLDPTPHDHASTMPELIILRHPSQHHHETLHRARGTLVPRGGGQAPAQN